MTKSFHEDICRDKTTIEVEADFYLFADVAADGYSTRSEMIVVSSVKHREGGPRDFTAY